MFRGINARDMARAMHRQGGRPSISTGGRSFEAACNRGKVSGGRPDLQFWRPDFSCLVHWPSKMAEAGPSSKKRKRTGKAREEAKRAAIAVSSPFFYEG